MKTKLILLSALFLALTLTLTLASYAAIPHLMNFQGKATDTLGAPLNGTYNLTFRIYNSETGGTPKWTEAQSNISISNGIFQVQLGSVTPLNLPFDESYWISIEINTDGEMSPRTRLASVGYAYTAETANNTNMPVGSVVQVVNYRTGEYATGSTAIPCDDSIPQITEGTEFMALAITPTSITNKLKIDVVFYAADNADNNGKIAVALFNTDYHSTNAMAVGMNDMYEGATHYPTVISFTHYMTTPSVSATTFRVRAGLADAGTMGFNGLRGRFYGGVMASSITITEIKA